MDNKEMLKFMVINRIVYLDYTEDIQDSTIIIEDAGKVNDEFINYSVCVDKNKSDAIISMYQKYEPENAQHVAKILNHKEGFLVVCDAIKRRNHTTITNYLFEHFENNIDAIFEYFGFGEIIPSNTVQMNNVEQSFNSDTNYNNLKEREETSTISGIPDSNNSITEHNNTLVENEEDDTLSRDELLDILDIIMNVDKNIDEDYVNWLLTSYDRGEEEFVTKKVIKIVESLEAKGLIS